MQGFFGKIPSHGDFVTRNLSREFLDPWDSWLQSSIAESKTRLGDRWLDVYLTSPIWRFALKPGVCGKHAWAGLLMPSVDRVGRYFPLTIVASLPDGSQPFHVVAGADTWFQATEALALRALDDDKFDAGGLQSALEALAGIDCAAQPTETLATTADEWSLAAPGPVGIDVPILIADRLAHRQAGAYSLWWTIGSEAIAPSTLLVGGLPSPGSFAELLRATWGDQPADHGAISANGAGTVPDAVGS